MKRPEDIRAMRAISLAIQRHVQETRVTQEQLAERIGVSQSALSRYVSQTSIPRGGVLMRLARELGVSAAALVGNTDDTRLTATVTVIHRIGGGDASNATLAVPLSAFPTDEPLGDIVGIEIGDTSADMRFPRNSVLVCAPWRGGIRQHAIAVVAASLSEITSGPFRVASAGALLPSSMTRAWWSLSSIPGQDGPLPTNSGEIWTAAYRPLVVIAPIESPF